MTTTKTPPQNELKLTGKGVEPVRIPSVDKAISQYISDEDTASRAALKHGESEDKLIAAMHKNADQLRQPDGSLMYRGEDRIVSLIVGNEKLKVKKAGQQKPNGAKK